MGNAASTEPDGGVDISSNMETVVGESDTQIWNKKSPRRRGDFVLHRRLVAYAVNAVTFKTHSDCEVAGAFFVCDRRGFVTATFGFCEDDHGIVGVG